MRKFMGPSIWAPESIPPEEWKYRNLKRVMFPVFDGVMVLAGISAFVFGVPTLNDLFPDIIVQSYGIAMIVAALACSLGASFPKFWPADIAGSTILLGLSTAFLASIVFRTFVIDTTRVFGFFFIAGTVCIILWRLTLLSEEWQQRRADARTVANE